MIAVTLCLCTVLTLVAATAAILAALWARESTQAVDGFAAIVLPLLIRVKNKVDPDPTVATVVAAAAAPSEAEEVHRKVQPLTEAEAARPSSGDLAMDRPSWDGRTAVYDKAQVHAALGGAVPLARVVPAGAALGRGEARAKEDSSPTLASAGVVPGARARHDPRAPPEGAIEEIRAHGAR